MTEIIVNSENVSHRLIQDNGKISNQQMITQHL